MRRTTSLRVLLAAALLATGVPPLAAAGRGASPSSGQLLYAWTQLAPGGTAFPGATVPLARAILAGQGQGCPVLVLTTSDGNSQPAMVQRPNPLPGKGNYPITVCEAPAVVPGFVVLRATVFGRALPLPPASTAPARIAVVGDTGCRKNDNQQPCNNEDVWPFGNIAKEIARKRDATLVVHVGDYRYRKDDKPCDSSCAPPLWDNWDSWEKDFFKPAEPLLAAAPWVMVRGNHEDCNLADKGNGRGWFYLLDPSSPALGSPTPACNADPERPTYTTPYALDVVAAGQPLRLIVLDSADAPDEGATPCPSPEDPKNAVCVYTFFFHNIRELAQAAAGPSWLLSHRPLWAVKKAKKCDKPPEVINQTLQLASGNQLPSQVELLVAGHYHVFESMSWPAAASRPPLVVAGMSGVNVSNGPRSGSKGTFAVEAAGAQAQVGFWSEHAYLMMRRDGPAKPWDPRLYSIDESGHESCRWSGSTFDCGFKPAKPCDPSSADGDDGKGG